MVLPPYVYSTDWREMKAHVARGHRRDRAAVHALQQPDRLQDRFPAAADRRSSRASYPNLHAVKESSGDVRRVTAMKALCRRAPGRSSSASTTRSSKACAPARSAGSRASSTRCPRESVALFRPRCAATHARRPRALPLVPAAAAHGHGAEVRPADQARAAGSRHGQRARRGRRGSCSREPEREEALATIRAALASRPAA